MKQIDEIRADIMARLEQAQQRAAQLAARQKVGVGNDHLVLRGPQGLAVGTLDAGAVAYVVAQHQGGHRAASVSGTGWHLLGSLGGVAVVQTGGDTDTGETGPVTDGGVAGQAPAADPVAPVAEAVVQTASADADKIMLYLQNDTRWAWRTADGIATDLEVDAGLVGEALDALVTKGSLRRKAKRDDATVKVYALVPAAGTVTVTVDDLVSYLRSHSRFTKRTKAANEARAKQVSVRGGAPPVAGNGSAPAGRPPAPGAGRLHHRFLQRHHRLHDQRPGRRRLHL